MNIERQQSKRSADSPQIVPIHIEHEQPRTADIGESVLRYQNTCLATRIDYQKKLILDQRKIITTLTDRELRTMAFFKNLYTVWNSFISRCQRIHQMLKKNGQCKIEGKFISAFSYLDQVFISQNVFVEDENFSRQIGSKFLGFLRTIENIYMEIAAEYDEWTENVSKELSSLDDDSEYLKNLVKECKDVIQKGKEIEKSFKSKLQMKERKINDLEVQFGHQSIFKIQQMLSESRRENMHLTRRVRLLTEYNFKNIKYKSEDEDLKSETFECVCGGSQMATYKSLQDPQLSFIGSSIDSEDFRRQNPQPEINCQQNGFHVNVNHLNQLIQKTVRNRNLKVNQVDENLYTINLTHSELMDLQNTLNSYYAIQQKLELTQNQYKRLSEQCVKAQEQLKNYELRLSSCSEQFYSSDLFQYLQQHNKHLVELNSILNKQVKEQQSELQDTIYSRQAEIVSLRNQFENEIMRLSVELNQTRQQLNEKRTLDAQNLAGFDIEQFQEGLRQRNFHLQKVCDSSLQELQSLRQQLSAAKAKEDKLEKHRYELQQKVTELEQKCMMYQSKLPDDFKIESFQFRHQKHKDFIVELNNYIVQNSPQFKERYQELSSYLRSRDQRVAESEKKIQQQEGEIKQLKKQQDLMLSESEINQNTYLEIQRNAKLIEQQLQIKEQSEARIIQEKIAEKAQFDAEKQQLIMKIKNADEVIKKQLIVNQDLQSLVNSLHHKRDKLQEMDMKSTQTIHDLTASNEYFMSKHSQSESELNLLKEKIQNSQLINQSVLKELELNRQRVLELEEAVKKNEEILNSPKLLEQIKGYTVLKTSEQGDNLISQLKEVASCSECTLNPKDVFLWRCSHMLCQPCAEKAVFKEKCPICNTPVSISEIWKVKMTP